MTDTPDKSQDKYVCISYVPLLTGEPGVLIGPDHAKSLIDRIPMHPGLVDACMFVAQNEQSHPVFIMRNAHKIYEHLIHWSEKSPPAWFKIYFHEPKSGHYMIALQPDIKRSMMRFKEAMKIKGVTIPSYNDIRVLYRPLIFISRIHNTYDKIKKTIPTRRVKVGFIDMVKVVESETKSMEEGQDVFIGQHIEWTGPFRVGKSKDVIKYLDQVFAKHTADQETGNQNQELNN